MKKLHGRRKRKFGIGTHLCGAKKLKDIRRKATHRYVKLLQKRSF